MRNEGQCLPIQWCMGWFDSWKRGWKGGGWWKGYSKQEEIPCSMDSKSTLVYPLGRLVAQIANFWDETVMVRRGKWNDQQSIWQIVLRLFLEGEDEWFSRPLSKDCRLSVSVPSFLPPALPRIASVCVISKRRRGAITCRCHQILCQSRMHK